MPNDRSQELEFIGGPLDGYSENFEQPLHSPVLVKTVDLPRHWLVKWMKSVFLGSYKGTFLVAVYELELCKEQLKYRYLTTNVASEISERAAQTWVLLSDSFQTVDEKQLGHGVDLDQS